MVAGDKKKQARMKQETRAKIEDQFKDEAEEAIRYMVSVMRDKTLDAALRLAAANDVADRVYGKPSQAVKAELVGDVKVYFGVCAWPPALEAQRTKQE